MEITKRKVIKGRSHVEGYQKPVHRKRLLVEFLSGPCVIWTSKPFFSDRILMRRCQGMRKTEKIKAEIGRSCTNLFFSGGWSI